MIYYKATRPPWWGRFMAKVDTSVIDGCWFWKASVGSHGYGQFVPNGRGTQALSHRLAYEVLVGPIPDGLTLDHICRQRRCVNPAHLEPVPLAENKARGESPAAKNARKETCLHGHSDWVLRRDGKGRRCRTCENIRNAARAR